MRIIVLASQKGGSGKTTLSGHLAVQAEISGAGPVALIDTDPQGSLSKWWNARAAETPAFVAARFDNLESDLDALRAQGFKTVIIDTPPAVTRAIAQVVGHADIVVMPTRPSPHDLRAVGATVEIAESHGKAMIFVLNAATARAKITAEAAVTLSQHGTVAPVTLHHRVDYAASMTDGRTVMEYNANCASAKEVRGLWEYLQDRLNKLDQTPREFTDPFAFDMEPASPVAAAPERPVPAPRPVLAQPAYVAPPVEQITAPEPVVTLPVEPVAKLPESNPQQMLMDAVRSLQGDGTEFVDPLEMLKSLADNLPASDTKADNPLFGSSPAQSDYDDQVKWSNISKAANAIRATQGFGRRWR